MFVWLDAKMQTYLKNDLLSCKQICKIICLYEY